MNASELLMFSGDSVGMYSTDAECWSQVSPYPDPRQFDKFAYGQEIIQDQIIAISAFYLLPIIFTLVI